MWQINMLSLFFFLLSSLLLVIFFRTTSALHILHQWLIALQDRLHLHQSFKIPRYNHHSQENQLYRKILTYLDSLPDNDYTNLFSGPNPSDIFLQLDPNHTVNDTFLGARLSWTTHAAAGGTLVLRLKKKDKRRVFRQYFQHILSVADEIEQRRKKDVKLYVNTGAGEWRSAPFSHPASFDTIAMDAELKSKVKSDLDQFLKSKQYYHRLGRVWKRSYLLYGAPGTGKSSFVAAMAKFLAYDVYDVDAAKFADGGDWKAMLMQTTARSLIVIEDLDRVLAAAAKSSSASSHAASLSSVLNFMDGIVSCCGEERVMVFTMNGTKEEVDQTVLRPGRVDVHIHFPLCDFSTFKILASSYLGLKEHKLFPQLEEVFQTGARLSPAEVGEIMISNRNSPTRALKTVISALHLQPNALDPRFASGPTPDDNEPGSVICRESVHTVREFRKLYGLLRLGSRRKDDSHSGPIDKDPPRIAG